MSPYVPLKSLSLELFEFPLSRTIGRLLARLRVNIFATVSSNQMSRNNNRIDCWLVPINPNLCWSRANFQYVTLEPVKNKVQIAIVLLLLWFLRLSHGPYRRENDPIRRSTDNNCPAVFANKFPNCTRSKPVILEIWLCAFAKLS